MTPQCIPRKLLQLLGPMVVGFLASSTHTLYAPSIAIAVPSIVGAMILTGSRPEAGSVVQHDVDAQETPGGHDGEIV